MSGRYKAYGEYKDSNIQFLGNIPTNWHVGKIKSMLSLKRELVGSKSSAFQLLSLTLKGIIHRDISSGEGKIPASFETYQSLEKGELVFCLFDIDETPRTVGISSQNGMITGAYNIYRNTENCVPNYAYYYFLHIDSFKGLKPFYTGLRKVVRTETFANIEMFCPSLLEQTQIAAFLDHETAKIDTLIDKQQQLIELLKEKRQAVISHAVTKGLDPDVPMKDSGVEWLGEVPEHWKVIYIKHLSEVKRGASPRPIDDQKYFDEEGEYAWTRIADVSLAGMYLKDTQQRLSSLGSSLSVKLERGELFLSIAGTVGKPCITTSKACIHDGFVYFPSLKINNKYLFYIFDAGQAYLGLGKMGTQLNLNTDTVGCIKVALPPSLEIHEIVSYIVKQKEKYDLLITSAYEFIELIQERRTALISAAVTGKIDVRDWQVPVTQTESDEVMA
ncbi:restriction endonuclease subunit S [Rahnella bonaserana]|uniref:restriction endonuclease subunit S n=1 Tax=Rahnella bonaserana TaxID=2816248 RepID=UPI00320A63E3